MRTTTEVMSIKQFMDRNYHMDALGAVLGLGIILGIPAYYCLKLPPALIVAYKVLPIAIAL